MILTGMTVLATVGFFGNKLAAQNNNYMNDFKQLTSFTLHHDNDGFDNIFILARNPYENKVELQMINNAKGKLASSVITLDYNIQLGFPKQ